MTTQVSTRPALYALLWTLVLVIVIADQLSKAYFVYALGTHQAPDFTSFAQEYFTLYESDPSERAITKNYAVFNSKGPITVWPNWINFRLTTNTGAAWSIFEGNSFALSGVSLAMALLLYIVWWRGFRRKLGMTWALGAIIGGALGNFIDRFRVHEVVDFISVKIPYIGRLFPELGDPYDFPIFNVADSCAVCGTIALAVYLITADFSNWRKSRTRSAQPEFVPYQAPLGDVELARWSAEELKRRDVAFHVRTDLGQTVHIGPPAEAAESVAVEPAAKV